MKIGELAEQVEVNVQTIRYYERMQLLVPAGRTDGGYREYGLAAPKAVRFIKRAQTLGFTLKEISALLSLRATSSSSCARVSDRTETKIREIEAKIADLGRLKDALVGLKAGCASRNGGDGPILAALDQ